ncbi:hypothetical protein PUNSTDRAFT_96283 [Punctularia strigosozonata HHB-11173 SS5]|uniref:uncharacterized protein n=1 Tax=Punctularia strigosozonata (strain HHB-11173) TaxID=741275 RepID=UPI0004417292|nr:uncharacterized protein PUNSTDRAFT_96283 [Punctularia strigosozonata HHB-11173 SS5]EIN14427.1 hypothetical protein PUNSTDRAFT_96283 [Punctularia strigosozonata HHB-11173 SS5]
MWIAHYSAGLVAKVFAPGVPLWLLTLASEITDAQFFVFNLLGLESWSVDPALAKKGCFPYATNYPWSHSLAGMAITGVVLAGLYKAYSSRRVTVKDLLAIVLTTVSHFLYEWPAHRQDVKIAPHDKTSFGAGLFDYPATLFVLETAIFFAGLKAYTSYAPLSTRAGYKHNSNRMKAVVAVFLFQQAQFCFGFAPTENARWVHAPLFLSMILGSSWLLGKLEA